MSRSPNRSTRPSPGQSRAGAGVAALGVLAGVVQWVLPASAQTVEVALAPEPAAVTVEATRDILVAQSSPWLDAMAESELSSVTYRSLSSAQARGHFLDRTADAAVVGTPFTATELQDNEPRPVISVPFHVSAAMLLLSEPFAAGFRQLVEIPPSQNPICDPLGDDYDPSVCQTVTDFDGPVRVPPANLAAMLFDVQGQGLSRWRHPDVLEAMAAPNLALGPLDRPTVIHREPGESVNLYLQQYAVTEAPAVWEMAKAEQPERQFEVDEGISGAITRSTPTFQGQQVGLWQTDPRTGGATSTGWAGNLAAIPPTVKAEVEQVFPLTPLRVVEVLNQAGEYVVPTPASISKAVAAGGSTPLAALTSSIPGAYPLTWVDRIQLPTGGLEAAEVNALAAFVRYVVTLGQEGAASLGEGRLSPALVAEALGATDDMVEANCTGIGLRVVRSTDPGPYAPEPLGAAGIGAMAHCQEFEVRSTTTTSRTAPPATTSTTSPSGAGSSTGTPTTIAGLSVSTTASTSVPATTVPARAVGSGLAAPPTTAAPRQRSSTASAPGANLTTSTTTATSRSSPGLVQRTAAAVSRISPFPRPGGAGGFDGFTTMLLGASLYLGGRHLVRSRGHRRPSRAN